MEGIAHAEPARAATARLSFGREWGPLRRVEEPGDRVTFSARLALLDASPAPLSLLRQGRAEAGAAQAFESWQLSGFGSSARPPASQPVRLALAPSAFAVLSEDGGVGGPGARPSCFPCKRTAGGG